MIATAPQTEQRTIQPSTSKYGSLIEDGFTQVPHSIEDYLHHVGLCSTAILLIYKLLYHRWKPEQEVYPSVRKMADSLHVSARRVNQITAQLVEMGLLIKTERFAERSQAPNYYDLEPLFQKVAAWKDPQIAADLAAQEAQADEPFQPQSVIEEAALCISEEYGEPAPRQIRYNAQRFARRWEQSQLEWEKFTDLVEKAADQTEKRAKEATRTGKKFTKLVSYFFSALDYHLSKVQRAPVTTKPQTTQNTKQPPSERSQQTARPPKAKITEALKTSIEATALTFKERNVKSAVQRAANLMARAQIDEARMCELVAEARAKTSATPKIKNRIAYFFAILEKSI